MAKYKFNCPNCKTLYQLTVAKPETMVNKTFVCNKCGHTNLFSKLLPIPSQPTNPSKTIPDGYNQQSDTKKHTHVVVSDGEAKAYLTVASTKAKYVLKNGIYVLGRDSSDSSATLRLAPDITMSRQHARLIVQTVGGKTVAQITGLKFNNPVIVNGNALPANRPFTLKSGDVIQLGATKVQLLI